MLYFLQNGLKEDVLKVASENVECLKLLAVSFFRKPSY